MIFTYIISLLVLKTSLKIVIKSEVTKILIIFLLKLQRKFNLNQVELWLTLVAEM